jgi:hypothetical protein
VVASTYLVEEVSGSNPGYVILKLSKIVPTAAMLGSRHIRVKRRGSHYLLMLESFLFGLRSQLGWLLLSVRENKTSILEI